VAVGDQPTDQMTADEATTAGDERPQRVLRANLITANRTNLYQEFPS
jgi:hypothetical protein